jgi:predicted GTPase
MVHYLTFDEVGITVAVVGIALAFVVLTWNAVKAIHDWRQLARRPTDDRIEDHEKRIVHLEECCEEVHGKLDSDWQFRQDEVEINKLMLKSIKHLIQHEVDGNDKASLQEMEKEIDNWLLDHAK